MTAHSLIARMLSSHFERADEARPALAVKHRCSPRVRARHGDTVRSNVVQCFFLRKRVRGDVDCGRSERVRPADSFGPDAPVKSGARLKARVPDETTEARGGETGCSRAHGRCSHSGFKTGRSGCRRRSWGHPCGTASRESCRLLTARRVWEDSEGGGAAP